MPSLVHMRRQSIVFCLMVRTLVIPVELQAVLFLYSVLYKVIAEVNVEFFTET